MKTIDKRVLDIEKADFGTKSEHDYALKMNVMKRIFNTPDEKFDIIARDCVSLKINDDIKITLSEADTDAKISVYYDDSVVNSFFIKNPYRPSWAEALKEEGEQDSDCEMLRNKIKSVREIKLKVTEESKKFMSEKTKRFYAAFDAISGNAE